MRRGQFLVVEGLEGAGKSTALKTLQDVLTQHAIPYVTTREPGGTEVGEAVRHIVKTHKQPLDPKSELLLFYAARVQLLQQVIHPALAEGRWVLADRFELSSFAYQGGGRGIDQAFIHQLSTACVGSTQPDCLFYLDISPEVGLQRAYHRGKLDRIEQESEAFFHAVHRAYRDAISILPRAVVIDAKQPLDAVQHDLRGALEQYLVEHDVHA